MKNRPRRVRGVSMSGLRRAERIMRGQNVRRRLPQSVRLGLKERPVDYAS